MVGNRTEFDGAEINGYFQKIEALTNDPSLQVHIRLLMEAAKSHATDDQISVLRKFNGDSASDSQDSI